MRARAAAAACAAAPHCSPRTQPHPHHQPLLQFLNAPPTQPNSYKLNIWDVGGQRTLRPYWRNYYEKTDGLVWVVDASDLARLEDTRSELKALLQEERLMGATLLVLANKQDIESALGGKQLEEALGLEGLAKRRWRVVPCSARTGEGLREGFEWVVKDIGSRIYCFND